MDVFDALFGKNSQKEVYSANIHKNSGRHVEIFRNSKNGYGFIIGPIVNRDYNFEEQITNKIAEHSLQPVCSKIVSGNNFGERATKVTKYSRLSKEAIRGIATIAAAIDSKLVSPMQKESYILSLRGKYKHLESLGSKSVKDAHLILISMCARDCKFSNINTLSYSVETGNIKLYVPSRNN